MQTLGNIIKAPGSKSDSVDKFKKATPTRRFTHTDNERLEIRGERVLSLNYGSPMIDNEFSAFLSLAVSFAYHGFPTPIQIPI